MVYKLHGIDMSTCTQRVQLIANEIGLSSPDQLETIWVDYKNGKHKSDAFLEINPFGQVPGFEDTDSGLVFHE
jgi:glutathione S-transferase